MVATNIQHTPGYVLVHRARAGRQPLFPPLRLKSSVTYIGRLGGNDVVLDSELISRRHAKLIVSDLGVTVHDLDSHNGIFLNGKKVRSTPVGAGDLLYVGDVCLAIRPARLDEAAAPVDLVEGLNKSDLVVRAARGGVLADEDDPAVKNLAALVRATDLLFGPDGIGFKARIIEICRDLTGAAVAVFLERGDDDALDASVVLQPDTLQPTTARAGDEAPVSWPVVRRCIDERVALFSKDVEKDPLVPDDPLAAASQGAVMCVPVVGDVDGDGEGERRALGAVYLSRSQAGAGFTDRELETVAAITHVVAAKLRGGAGAQGAVPAAAQQALAEATAARAKQDAELSALRAENAALRADHQSVTAKAAAAAQEAARAQGELERAGAGAASSRGEIEKARAEAEALRAELARARADLERQDGAMRRLDDDRKRIEDERRKAVDDARNLEGEAQRLKADVERLAASASQGDDVAARLEAEIAKARDDLRGAIDDASAAARARDAAVGELEIAASEVERLTAALQSVEADAGQRVEEASRDAEAVAEELSSLREALADVVPRALGARLESIAEGTEPADRLEAGPTTALYLSLSGCDLWAAKASAEDVKARLDRFCAAVAARAKANGGDVAGVLGHAHLVVFSPDAAGVRGAVRCALEVAALVPLDAQGGVQAGLHCAAGMAGFCGDGAGAVLVEVGEAVAVARGAAEWAQPGTVYATDAVRTLLGGDPAFMLIGAGPSLVRGIPTPVTFYLVGKAEGLPT